MFIKVPSLRTLFVFIIVSIAFSFFYEKTFASDLPDSDRDGISDFHEINKYFTDEHNSDSDYDGFSDSVEVRNGFSPLHKGAVRTETVDTDNDKLNDALEFLFGTNIRNKDTDNDGFTDKVEIDNGFDPKTSEKKKLTKKIEVSIADQRLYYLLDGVKMGDYLVSTGRNDSTPRGTFKIGKKIPRAWSRTAHLWMPYWMPFDRHLYGFHELPEWPNGKKEGQDHLGKPVSGGCIRLGVGDARALYEWAPEGTVVSIK